MHCHEGTASKQTSWRPVQVFLYWVFCFVLHTELLAHAFQNLFWQRLHSNVTSFWKFRLLSISFFFFLVLRHVSLSIFFLNLLGLLTTHRNHCIFHLTHAGVPLDILSLWEPPTPSCKYLFHFSPRAFKLPEMPITEPGLPLSSFSLLWPSASHLSKKSSW